MKFYQLTLKVKVTGVAEWHKDVGNSESIYSHCGKSEALRTEADEEEAKKESNAWADKHLPYTTDVDIVVEVEYDLDLKDFDPDEYDDEIQSEVIDHMQNEEGNNPCYGDILLPLEIEYEVESVELS